MSPLAVAGAFVLRTTLGGVVGRTALRADGADAGGFASRFPARAGRLSLRGERMRLHQNCGKINMEPVGVGAGWGTGRGAPERKSGEAAGVREVKGLSPRRGAPRGGGRGERWLAEGLRKARGRLGESSGKARGRTAARSGSEAVLRCGGRQWRVEERAVNVFLLIFLDKRGALWHLAGPLSPGGEGEINPAGDIGRTDVGRTPHKRSFHTILIP